MRIVAGKYGGRRLAAPKGMGTRPTADRVREALFSILFDVGGLSVLDLFAGTGAIGLEAISRGAKRATFVESERTVLAVLEKNIASLEVPKADHAIVKLPVEAALAKLAKDAARFDLIFADPPYREAARLLPGVLAGSASILASGGRIVLELSSKGTPPEAPLGLQFNRSKRYGETALAFYERTDSE
jgi:16S rRNA (guanine966-N2)-methyltransferase